MIDNHLHRESPLSRSAGERLAAFASTLEWENLPPALRAQLKLHVLDTIGVMFAGLDTPEGRAAQAAAAGWGSGDEATAVGLDGRLPAPSAAFLNALHARIYTFDDTYEPGTLHPGSAVVAAALAAAESVRATGKLFLSAVAAGYEVATRVAAAVSPGHYACGFHNTGTCNAFGAAAAVARVFALDAGALAETLGLAGATAAGMRQHQLDGSMFDSAFHGARAAQCGVMVGEMRMAGLRGPKAILDGPMGFCRVMAPRGADTSRLDRDLGAIYEAAQTTIKPFPSCRFNHGPIQVVLDLRNRHRIDYREVARVEIRTFRQSIEVSDRARIRSPYDATVSHQFAVANALTRGNVTLAAFVDPGGDPEIAALMERIAVLHDEELEKSYPAKWPHRMTIAMRDGRTFEGLSEYPPGRLEPIPAELVEAKFASLARGVLGEQAATALAAQVGRLEQLSDIREMTALSGPRAARA